MRTISFSTGSERNTVEPDHNPDNEVEYETVPQVHNDEHEGQRNVRVREQRTSDEDSNEGFDPSQESMSSQPDCQELAIYLCSL